LKSQEHVIYWYQNTIYNSGTVLEPNYIEFEISVEKLKMYKLPVIEQVHAAYFEVH